MYLVCQRWTKQTQAVSLAVDEIVQQRVGAEGDVTVIAIVNTACVVSSVANTIS